MRRALPWIVLVVLAALTFVPAALYVGGGSSDDSGYEPTRISRYNAVFDVDESGDMEVTETLIVRFPGNDRHGIFRFFDAYDRNDAFARRVPQGVVVSRDGRPEQVERSTRQQGRLHVLRIGDPDATVPAGEHTYVIRYRVEGVLLDEGDGARFYWDLVPSGWAQSIDAAELTVRLPEAPQGDVRCAVGVGRSGGCDAQVDGPTLTVRAEGLGPRTPVTVAAELPSPPPGSESRLAWPVFLSPVLGRWTWLLVVVLLAAAGVGLLGRRIAAPMLEKPPSFPLQYAPPEGIGPAQGAYLLTERTRRRAFVASLMHAAERGEVQLEREESQWTLTRVGSPRPALDAVTRRASGLAGSVGEPFVAAKDDVEAGRRLQKAMKSHDEATKEWALREGHLTRAGAGSLAGIAVVAALCLYLLLLFTLQSTMTVLALVPAAFAAMALPVLYPGATTKRTDAGRRLWEQLGGFHRVLSTPSSVARFDFSGRQELFTAYLPWAVAFGCAPQWARKFRTETAQEPPDPVWMTGVPFHSGGGAERLVDDFSSTLGGAVASYHSSQSGSRSGGGFSGGGGGGGGGGGSW